MFIKSQKTKFDGKFGVKKRHISKLGLYVIFSISFVVLYSIAVLVIFARNGVEPDTLTKCVYSFFAGEVTASAIIKIFNIKNPDKINTTPVEDEEVQE